MSDAGEDCISERQSTEKFQNLLQFCCHSENPDVLQQCLATATCPDLIQAASLCLPELFQIATLNGDIRVLDQLQVWAKSHGSLFTKRHYANIATSAQEKYQSDNDKWKAEATFCWWALNTNIDEKDGQLLCLAFIWALSINSLEGLSCLLQKIGAKGLETVLLDPDECKSLVSAIAVSPQFIEILEMLRWLDDSRDLVEFLLQNNMVDILSQAAEEDNLRALIYLLCYTKVPDFQRASLDDRSNLPGLLDHPLQRAFARGNFAAALLLREHGARAPLRRLASGGRRDDAIGGSGVVRQAILVLLDDAWNVMQHTGRTEMREIFKAGKIEIEKVKQEVQRTVDSIGERQGAGKGKGKCRAFDETEPADKLF